MADKPATSAPQNGAMQTPPKDETLPAGAFPSVRLFVGGLPADVTLSELQARFKPFGTVLRLEIVPQKEEKAACRGFAYVDLAPASEATLKKCFTVYNGAKWRGGKLRVEKARATFLNRLKAEWVAQTEGPTKMAETNEGQKTGERLDKAKPIIEPLRLKWGSWQFEKRTKVVPAAGGPKIKKSFRNVPEKSLWELEGIGGERALTANGAANEGPIYIEAEKKGALHENGGHVNGRKYSKEERHTSAVSEEEGTTIPAVQRENEADKGSEDDFGSVSRREDSETNEDENEVTKEVKELTPWERLMQKAAAGQEDDDFIDEEMGSLEGFGKAAETQQEVGRNKGAEGKQGLAREKVEVQENGKPKEEDSLENGGPKRRKIESLSDWQRLLQRASGTFDDEASEETQPVSHGQLAEEEGLAEASPDFADVKVHQELSEEGSKRDQSEKNVLDQGLSEGAGQIGRQEEKTRHIESPQKTDIGGGRKANGLADVIMSSFKNAQEGATEMPSGELEEGGFGAEASPSESDVSKEGELGSESDVSERGGTGYESDISEREEAGSESDVPAREEAGSGIDVSRREEAESESDVSMGEEAESESDVSEQEEAQSESDVSMGEEAESESDVSAREEAESDNDVSEGKEANDVSKIAEPTSSPLLKKRQLLEPAAAGKRDFGDHKKDVIADGAANPDEDDVRQGDADVVMVSEGKKGQEREQLTTEERPLDADFEVAPVGDPVEEDDKKADGSDDVRTPHRTAEDEEIARQLAEERKRQLGILGAMFPDEARFFSEERSQKLQTRSGFVPVARYDPSAQEAPTKESDPSETLQPEDSVQQREEVAEEKGKDSENAQSLEGRGAEQTIKRKSERESRKRKSALETDLAVKKTLVERRETQSEPKKRHLGKKESTRMKEALAETINGGSSGGREKGDTAVGMVSEVVAQLSPQVLKFLDPALLQQLAPAVKKSEPKRGREMSRQERGREAEKLEERRVSDGTLKEAGQNKSGRKEEHGKKGNDARTKRKRGPGDQEEHRQEGKDAKVMVKPSGLDVNPPPEQEQDKMQYNVDERAGPSLEERRRLKREKRVKRRELEEVKDSIKPEADAPQVENEVKQEVFVNPNWRALVGYVGNEKPTFSLSSVLPLADVALPEPSDLQAAPESTALEPLPHADISHVSVLPAPEAAVVQDVTNVIQINDEEVGLSFVRSENAEKEWLASKSALAIDYKRKKRVAARVAPKGGAKRRG